MPRTYLPPTDASLLDWATNFSAKLNLGPEAYGLSIEQAAAYTAVKNDYETKLAASIAPETRGGATVLAKKNAKKTLIAESRTLAMAATSHPGVTDEQRYDLGLTVKDVEPTPVPPPDTSPVLSIVSTHGQQVKLKLQDAEGSGRAKPDGVLGATVLTAVGTLPPASEAEWTFEFNTTQTAVDVNFADDVPAGSQVWLTAFWFNRKTQSGPAADPITTRLAGTLGQAA